MSYAQFLGQQTPYYSTETVSLADQNWITYLTTPGLYTNIDISSGVVPVFPIFTSPIIPNGYWNFVLSWELQATNGGNISSYEIYITSQLCPPSALPIFLPRRNNVINYYQTNTTTSNIVNNSISGLIWSDGSINSYLQIFVKAVSSNGNDIVFESWGDAVSFPCLNLFKIG